MKEIRFYFDISSDESLNTLIFSTITFIFFFPPVKFVLKNMG